MRPYTDARGIIWIWHPTRECYVASTCAANRARAKALREAEARLSNT